MNMMRPALASTGMNVAAAILKINGLALMFPQSEIRTLESASDVDSNDPAEKNVGWINYMGQRWPVYCLSEQLELLDAVPPLRRTCALLTLGSGYIGVLCDDVSILKQVEGRSYEVPFAMRIADTPIQSLIANKHELLCVCKASRLAAYIEHMARSV